MKRTTFVLLMAAVAAMGLVACEKEKSPGNFNTILNGIPMDDTVVVSIKYSYNPDSLVLTEFSRDGETQDYILDTVQKTLTYTFPENMPGNPEPMVFTLVEQ